MVFFMNGVVNPNSLESAATLATFTAILTLLRERKGRSITEVSVIAIVTASIAVNSRGLSPIWIALAIFLPFLLASWTDIRLLARRWVVRIAVIVIGLATAAALLWTFKTNSLASVPTSATQLQLAAGVGASPLRGFAQILAGTFDYGQGIVGVFGWLDTPAPAVVFFVWSTLIGGLMLLSIVLLRGRALAFTLALIGFLVFLPPLIQAVYIHGGGIVWQGRYALPLFVCVAIGLSAVLADRISIDVSSLRRIVVIVFAAWSFTQAYSAIFALKRYSVGVSGQSWRQLLVDPAWSPPGGTTVSVILIIGTTLAVGVFLAWLAGMRAALKPG
jgi:hypothetical protein